MYFSKVYYRQIQSSPAEGLRQKLYKKPGYMKLAHRLNPLPSKHSNHSEKDLKSLRKSHKASCTNHISWEAHYILRGKKIICVGRSCFGRLLGLNWEILYEFCDAKSVVQEVFASWPLPLHTSEKVVVRSSFISVKLKQALHLCSCYRSPSNNFRTWTMQRSVTNILSNHSDMHIKNWGPSCILKGILKLLLFFSWDITKKKISQGNNLFLMVVFFLIGITDI